MTLKKVTHCIFDLDGTIFDTEKVYFEAIDRVLQQFGSSHSLELCRKIIGRTRQDYSKIIVEEENLPILPEEFLDRMDFVSHSMFLNSSLMPGAKKLIRHLHKHRIPIAIGTSSNLASVDLKFTHHNDLRRCFDHVVSGTDDPDVLKGKPAPDVFLVAAERFRPAADPRNCLVFEDAPNGVRAALAAGMMVVMVPNPEVVTSRQRREPTLCLNSLEEFKPDLFGLPPYNEPEKRFYETVTHCIFDLDGTIFDTEKIYFQSIDEVLRQFGRRHSNALCQKIIGRSRQDYSRIIVEQCELPISPNELLRRIDMISYSLFLDIELRPGAKRLIHHLHKHNIPMAIATNSDMASVELRFKSHQSLKSCFSHIVSGTDDPEVLQGKPLPYIFLVTAGRFDPVPKLSKCLVFEHAPSGVKAGQAAGMQVVMIPDSEIVMSSSEMQQATLCLSSLEEFQPELFGLPGFE